ncbi:MAG: zinc ribbon domain-containing protein, partial [Gloeobacteraceae cyanobacterium ES-bin-144]|nr:zinc ribbon domain-containing protein [Verrucomicrobiales bacterium]
MNFPKQVNLNHSRLLAASGCKCPSCGEAVSADAKWCGSCGFTGGDSVVLFPDSPPPLLSVLDAAELWTPDDIALIEASRRKLRVRFPQFRFRVFTVVLPAETILPVFGFWLLNACPLNDSESAGDRSWTVLLLINAHTGMATVIPGYSAEHWLSEDDWLKALNSMASGWKAGETAKSVSRFFTSCGALLDRSWKRRGMESFNKSSP